MTDTGQVPGEGQPEHAGTVEQPGTPAPDAYTYLDPSAAATEDDDLLLMPGAQGAWTEPQPGVAPAPPVTVPLPQTPQGEQTPYEHTPQDPTAQGPATDGHGTAHTPRQPHPAQPPQQAPRRPRHMGPPMPDTGGVVRSLADRGPAPVAPAAPAPAPAPMPVQSAPAPGPEHQTAAVPATPEAQPWAQAPGPAETAAPDATATGRYAPAEGAAAPAPQLAPPAPTVPAPRHAAPAQHPAPEAPATGVPAQHAPVPPQVAEQAPEPVPAQPAAEAPTDTQPVEAQPVDAPPAEAAEAQPAEPSQPAEAATAAQPDTEPEAQPEPQTQATQTAAAPAEATPEPPAQPAQAQPTEPEPTEPPEAAPAADVPSEAPAGAPTEAPAPETAAPQPQPEPVTEAQPGPAAAQTEPPAAPASTPAPEPAAQADPAPADEVQAAVDPAPAEPNAPQAPEAPTPETPAADPAAAPAPADEAPAQVEPAAEPESAEPTAVPAPAEGAPEAAREAEAPAEAPSQEAPAASPAPEAAPVAEPVAETAPPAETPAEPQAETVPAPVATPEEESPAPAAEVPTAEVPADAVAAPVEPPAVEQAPTQRPGTEHAEPEAQAAPAEAPREPQAADAVAAPAPDSTVEPPAPVAATGTGSPETAAPATALDAQPAGTVPEAAPAPEAAPEPAPEAASEAAPEADPALAPEVPTPEVPGPEATAPETTPGPEASAPDAPAPETTPVAAPAPSGPPAPGYADDEREAILRVMRERRDIRNGFRSDPIPHEVLLRVLEAAHTAPSVGHSQPWDFVVIRSAETRGAMHELAQRQREAYARSLPKGRAKQFKELKIEAILDTPVNIVVTADPTRGGRHTLGRHTQPQMAPYSSALAVENLWLAARAEGLGVGWVSFFDEREMVRALGLPEHLEVVAYLCVGYVDEFPEEPELMQAGWSRRRPLSWVVHEETYGRRALPGEEPHDLLQETVAGIRPLDAKALGEAWERQKRMTKPSGALGMLEIISAQLCGLSRTCPPPIPEPAAVAIFAGDHGVHAQGVTAWPQEVTAQMVANFLGGGAVCNAFANQVGAEVCVVDVGVAAELPATPGLLPRKVRAGTADFTTGPALTRDEVLAAIEVGVETARDLVAAGNKAILTGEMGIANTTASAALISVYTGADPAEVTGRGTGINDEMHARKVDVVRRALELHQPDPADPIGVLGAVGGLEHAAMVGFVLGGASLRTPVILDGVSAGAAALVARAVAPESLAACIAGHRSAEPGHMAALNKLGLRPLVDLDLRLGEGTGALLALPLVQSAARAMHEVATFDSAGVTEK
ncbi:nicotinate-nucleotide--dimethylbenzimidazole phosphoribosyltransferase [Streptomyces fradiae]|uniref:nicotinate-nucleotide--dimethylbenzimidazole phosphoribosyltransferase n=1 Tax=Streptomyces fradiae TaxID=1906 RepID=UPI00368E8F1E